MESQHLYKEFRQCRQCGSEDLLDLLTLGHQRVIDFCKVPGESKRPIAPLELVMCQHCKLVQLRHTVNPEFLYTEFWYRSAVTDSMKAALQEIVGVAIKHTKLQPGDAVLDIGANDGTMLGMFPPRVITCGIDPSNQILTPDATKRMTHAVRAYFNGQVADALAHRIGKRFKVVTAIAMYYDLDDPISFLQQVKNVLHDDGVFIIQMNYLATMIKNNCVDNICHEHVAYYSFRSLEWGLSKAGFSVIDADVNAVNGGSLRVVCCKSPAMKDDYIEGAVDRVRDILDIEESMSLADPTPYLRFSKRVKEILEQVSVYIMQQTLKGRKCYGYGASTRGGTLLQSTPIVLSGVAERDPNKIGLYYGAGWLKIHDEDYVRERANVMLVLPWHFYHEIVEREKAFLEKGGELVFPLPTPRSVTMVDGKLVEQELKVEPIKSLHRPAPAEKVVV